QGTPDFDRAGVILGEQQDDWIGRDALWLDLLGLLRELLPRGWRLRDPSLLEMIFVVEKGPCICVIRDSVVLSLIGHALYDIGEIVAAVGVQIGVLLLKR